MAPERTPRNDAAVCISGDIGFQASGEDSVSGEMPQYRAAWTTAALAGRLRAAGLPVTLSRSGPVEMNDPALETTIHRMVKEALTNALRYAQDATEVRVRIDTGPEAIDVTVTDNGRPAAPSPSIGGGVGLTGIRERAAAFGGTSEAGPLRGGGWRTHARIPLRQESET